MIKNILKKYLPPSFWRRLRNFYYSYLRYIHDGNRYSVIRKHVKCQKREGYGKRRLLAIYDFADMPFTYDISTFLINAELQRRKKGLDKIDVAFVAHASDPGPVRQPHINKDNFRHYLHNFGLEITRLFDSVGSIFVFDNRQLFMDFFSKFKTEYFTFSEDYNPSIPIASKAKRVAGRFTHPAAYTWINSASEAKRDPTLLCLRPPKEQVNIVRKWILKNIYPNIPITITLRELDWRQPERNGIIPEWQKLIDSYKDTNIKFIVLRDYFKLYDAPVLSGQNIIYYNEPLLAVSLRAALYQESTLNLFTLNGCACPAVYNRKSRYITFKVLGLTTQWLHLGLRPGDNFQGSTKYQKLVWEPDTFEVMKPEVDKMIKVLEEDGIWVPKYYEKFKKDKK